MLVVFYGTDELRTQDAVSTYIEVQKENNPTITVERIEAAKYELGLLANLALGSSLFGGVTVYVLDNPSATPEYETELLEVASVLANSAQIFIVQERNLLAAPKKILTAAASAVTEYKQGVVKNFDAFAMAEALSRKDKRTLWLLLQEATANEMSAEEVVGILWWQLKILRLAAITKDAAAAGVKDYPYNKAKKVLSNFKPGELEKLSLSLLTFYHAGHGGIRDIDLALEEWVLTI